MNKTFNLSAKVEKLMEKEWRRSYGASLAAAQLLRSEASASAANADNDPSAPQHEVN